MTSVLGKLTARAWPWAIAATVLVAGFMYWLYAESSTIQVATVAADTTQELPRIADSAFVANPTQFSGRRILLEPVAVSEMLGRAAMTIDLPGLAGYPAILEGSIIETEIRIVGGDNLAIAGWVYALNDSILDVWAQRGLFEPEQRGKLTGKTTFFLVDSLDFVFPGQSESGQGSGQ